MDLAQVRMDQGCQLLVEDIGDRRDEVRLAREVVGEVPLGDACLARDAHLPEPARALAP